MRARARLAVAAVAGATVGIGYVLERAGARRWQVDEEALAESGRTLPAGLRHHVVTTSDGGEVHAVERGEGPPVVLVHGLAHTLAAWAPQLRQLSRHHRVVAVTQRGHGRSTAGSDGYSFDRLAGDLLEVLTALDVRRAVLCGHSLGGMVVQHLVTHRSAELGDRVARLVLVATTPGPVDLDPLVGILAVAAERGVRRGERRGRGLFPGRDLGVWLTRVGFGSRPAPADIELTRSMVDAMDPVALGALARVMRGFDVRDRLGAVALPTRVVVGTRDLLTPPRTARAIVSRLHGAALTLLPGCGHMVMLERAEELCDLLA